MKRARTENQKTEITEMAVSNLLQTLDQTHGLEPQLHDAAESLRSWVSEDKISNLRLEINTILSNHKGWKSNTHFEMDKKYPVIWVNGEIYNNLTGEKISYRKKYDEVIEYIRNIFRVAIKEDFFHENSVLDKWEQQRRRLEKEEKEKQETKKKREQLARQIEILHMQMDADQ
jgi:hypothetical protein